MAHSFFYAGDREAGILAARAYAKEELGLTAANSPDIIVFRYGLFSVEDARRVIRLADQAATGEAKLIVIAAERLFHEAQNALLKLFEEPPPGTTLVLVIPSAGVLLATLRSRILSLGASVQVDEEARAFAAASSTEREKIIAKLLERAKSDKDEEKQAARGEALRIVEGLAAASYEAWKDKENKELKLFMEDLDHFIPILHERSAPLKLIFEHILLTTPKLPKT